MELCQLRPERREVRLHAHHLDTLARMQRPIAHHDNRDGLMQMLGKLRCSEAHEVPAILRQLCTGSLGHTPR